MGLRSARILKHLKEVRVVFSWWNCGKGRNRSSLVTFTLLRKRVVKLLSMILYFAFLYHLTTHVQDKVAIRVQRGYVVLFIVSGSDLSITPASPTPGTKIKYLTGFSLQTCLMSILKHREDPQPKCCPPLFFFFPIEHLKRSMCRQTDALSLVCEAIPLCLII